MSGLAVLSTPLLLGVGVMALLGVAERSGLKDISTKGGSPFYFLAWGMCLTTLGFVSTYLLVWGWTMPASLLPGFYTATIVGAMANIGIMYFRAKAASYKEGELSLTAPLSAMTPGFITLLALALGEVPGPVGWCGVALMVAGSWMLLYKGDVTHWWEYLGPLQRLSYALRWSELSEKDKERTIVVYLVLCGSLLSTIGLLCDGLYARRGVDMQGLWLSQIILFGILGAAYLALWCVVRRDRALRAQSGTLQEPLFLLAIITYASVFVVTQYFIKPLYLLTHIGYVGTLVRLQILVSVVLGYVLWREQDIQKRFGAAVVIIIGAFLISQEELPRRLTDKIIFFGLL